MPILKVLSAEGEALKNATPEVANKLYPMLEVPKISEAIASKKCYCNSSTINEDYLYDAAENISKAWIGRAAMVDAFHWSPDAKVESGEHIIPYLYSRIEALGVHVVPVVGYDRWSSTEYRLAIKTIDLPDNRFFCLRLDSSALEDIAEPDFFIENIQSILNELVLNPNRCIIYIDFGDVCNLSLEQMLTKANTILIALYHFNFHHYAVAGCSLPSTIDKAVKDVDTVGHVLRREMVMWQSLRIAHPNINISLGDYGVRAPTSNEGIRNKHTNGKIRYTIGKHFFVARGHSMQWPGKGEQMWTLAQKIVQSTHFMGEHFSWGDARIVECSKKGFKGTAGQWIAIDTSHHISYVVAEVEEAVAAAPMKAYS